jgi:TRAP-type mannitol/chloroaromatic compound transport system permease small subunit
MHNKTIDGFLHFADFINKWAGRTVAWLVPVIMVITSYEVVMRYFFRAPTIWAWDINVQLFAVVVFFGGGYLLLHKGHVRVDVVYGRLPTKWKTSLDLITFPICFIYLVVLLWKFIDLTKASILEREVTNTLFAPPVYPLKIILVFAVLFFLMQGVAMFIRDIRNTASAGEK